MQLNMSTSYTKLAAFMHISSFNVEHNIVKIGVRLESITSWCYHRQVPETSEVDFHTQQGRATNFKRPTQSFRNWAIGRFHSHSYASEKESISVSNLTQYNTKTQGSRSFVSLTLTTQNCIENIRLVMEIFCMVTPSKYITSLSYSEYFALFTGSSRGRIIITNKFNVWF